jgi:hypothetical protein
MSDQVTEVPFDCSDIDQWLGKVIDSSPIREPLGNNDICGWVQAMHYPNLLHFDPRPSAGMTRCTAPLLIASSRLPS